jgi:NADH:ubiquinone oxidoreductase subunit 3 (subunit A)
MILIFCKTTLLLNCNFYMFLCGNNASKQKTAHSSMAFYVHVLLYNAAKHMFTC